MSSLDSLLLAATNGDGDSTDDLKFVFVGGKGGVGKTTSSSAIATLFAKHCNKNVLLVSTDPAHSLGDAFRMEFSNVPKSPMKNLDVMEVDPSSTMKEALESWTQLAEDLAGDSVEWKDKLGDFQEWLSGIPGIDEATALNHAITHIESGKYDLIVFDTAPTGHTLKLLALPDILQAGIEKLQSWQSTLWGYWEAFKGLRSGSTGDSSKRRSSAKEEISEKLEEYKRGIQKVACMLQDQARTRFVVVCIAEFLSVSETKRLLQELEKNQVRASHIIVNQLVTSDALSLTELQELESLAEVGGLNLNQVLLQKTVHACRLTTSRKTIQDKYLNELKHFADSGGGLEGICEVPLLPEEVTGAEAIQRFAGLLVKNPPSPDVSTQNKSRKSAKPLYDDMIYRNENEPIGKTDNQVVSTEWIPSVGDTVKVHGLAKAAQYNDLEGKIAGNLDAETGRYCVEVAYKGQNKKLALQPKNFVFIRSQDTSSSTKIHENDGPVVEENMTKAMKVLQDPEIQSMISANPRFGAAVQDVMQNPMNVMKYLGDPEMSPLIQKAMSKLGM